MTLFGSLLDEMTFYHYLTPSLKLLAEGNSRGPRGLKNYNIRVEHVEIDTFFGVYWTKRNFSLIDPLFVVTGRMKFDSLVRNRTS